MIDAISYVDVPSDGRAVYDDFQQPYSEHQRSNCVAQKIQTLFIDDIDGGDAEGTVRFGLDGAEYEIDLSSAHSDELRKTLETYIAYGRKVGGTARRGPRGGVHKDANAIDTVEVREWAKEQGIDIKERGRVPGKVVEQYRQAAGQ